jgi:transmembrane protein
MDKTIERLLDRLAADLISRVALTFPFWTSGVLKLIDFDAGVAEMARVGLEPAALFNTATIALQLTGSMLVIVGRYAWLGAGALGFFTGLTIPLVHHFWTMTEEPFRTIALHTAIEHIGIIGGLLAVAILTVRRSG